ncbi:leucine-rich repeat domain-containing protein, partial [Candidatus Poribacteria bacterium]|nr:leucine-rich repeat domain-containing protein [Candidatus Poribacteria bacterium]
RLKTLHFDRNQITDISLIEKFRRLTSLYVHGNPIQDMGPFQKFMEQNANLQTDMPAEVELNIQPPPANR